LASLPKEAIEMTEKDCQRCVSLIRELGLTYGAIDFLIDDKNRLVFLEVNPVGDWAWLEQQTGLRITEAIADFIEKKVN
jgi:glutathione synthase/RimK-type ligase-like ATP-grasp enzyme